MAPRNALEALSLRPTSLLCSAWPWRSVAYLAGGALLGSGTMLVAGALLVAGLALTLVVVGVVLLLATVLSGVLVARVERARMRLVDADVLPDPHRRPARPGLLGWLTTRLREQVTWRELGYATLSALLFWWMDAAVVIAAVLLPLAVTGAPLYIRDEPLGHTVLMAFGGPPFAVLMAYPATAWAGARAAMTRAILAPRAADADARLVEVTRSRARLADAFEVERRRIERDLHDGAQQRLVALSMHLGLARLTVPAGAPAAPHVAAAQDLARQALTELRELIRGVHPKVLTDRGLAAAVDDVAATSAVPVTRHVRLPRRLPAPVEVTAYFVVVEALANVARHSGAARAAVSAYEAEGRLVLDVRDDGRGGADPGRGSGLIGLADRVAVVGGTLALSSPHGGPTLVHVEIPCES
ncbi:sensor histidine kinase [Mangrovihabitans endophyticus]|uniref:histidine kinase n=1 Tax=Mangrovihabitans endophyticus TaxID=1751298 RepID=A0A8J3C3U3_9ACTN|nr:sensor histidine kinase [Mangrovihabitans endophyticus]GGL04098.1 histidine kinase [Mangrovihabitans endophyticus]